MVHDRDTAGTIRLSSIWMHEAASVMSVKLVKPRWFDWCNNYSTVCGYNSCCFYCLVLETSVSKAASDSSSVSDCHGSLSTVHLCHPTLRTPASVWRQTHLAKVKRETSVLLRKVQEAAQRNIRGVKYCNWFKALAMLMSRNLWWKDLCELQSLETPELVALESTP